MGRTLTGNGPTGSLAGDRLLGRKAGPAAPGNARQAKDAPGREGGQAPSPEQAPGKGQAAVLGARDARRADQAAHTGAAKIELARAKDARAEREAKARLEAADGRPREMTFYERAVNGHRIEEDILEDLYGMDIGSAGYVDREEKIWAGILKEGGKDARDGSPREEGAEGRGTEGSDNGARRDGAHGSKKRRHKERDDDELERVR